MQKTFYIGYGQRSIAVRCAVATVLCLSPAAAQECSIGAATFANSESLDASRPVAISTAPGRLALLPGAWLLDQMATARALARGSSRRITIVYEIELYRSPAGRAERLGSWRIEHWAEYGLHGASVDWAVHTTNQGDTLRTSAVDKVRQALLRLDAVPLRALPVGASRYYARVRARREVLPYLVGVTCVTPWVQTEVTSISVSAPRQGPQPARSGALSRRERVPSPRLRLATRQVDFRPTASGEYTPQAVLLSNDGDAELVVTLRLTGEEFRFQGGSPTRIAPGDHEYVWLSYAPHASVSRAPSGRLTLRTNDTGLPTVVIELRVREATGRDAARGRHPPNDSARTAVAPTDDLILWLPLDGDIVDGSAHRSVALAVGSYTFTPGVMGDALHLDGSSYLRLSQALAIDVFHERRELTLEGWVNLSRADHVMRIFGKQGGNCRDEFSAEARPAPGGAQLYFQVVDDCQRPTHVTSRTVLRLGAWYHVAFVMDKSELRIYVNGLLDATAAGVGNTRPFGEELQIGHIRGDVGNREALVGLLDELRIWVVARSYADIRRSATVSR